MEPESQSEMSRKVNSSIKGTETGRQLTKPNNHPRRQPDKKEKDIVSPIIETNLKQKDLDSISKKVGEAIASVVIDEIFPLQGSKPVPL